MRKILLAALVAITLMPVAAQAQSAREVRQDREEVRRDRAEVRGDIRRGDWREAREDRRELREDRRETREDWRDWREHHRDTYRLNAYAGPRGYTYREIAPGHRFARAYYDRRYWISNPWTYRLPAPAHGLRWVRYGNDVALVNVRTGRVVEVHNRFFW